MHVIVPFPPPTASLRYEIWQRLLPAGDQRAIAASSEQASAPPRCPFPWPPAGME